MSVEFSTPGTPDPAAIEARYLAIGTAVAPDQNFTNRHEVYDYLRRDLSSRLHRIGTTVFRDRKMLPLSQVKDIFAKSLQADMPHEFRLVDVCVTHVFPREETATIQVRAEVSVTNTTGTPLEPIHADVTVSFEGLDRSSIPTTLVETVRDQVLARIEEALTQGQSVTSASLDGFARDTLGPGASVTISGSFAGGQKIKVSDGSEDLFLDERQPAQGRSIATAFLDDGSDAIVEQL